jgi:hypothetical protein
MEDPKQLNPKEGELESPDFLPEERPEEYLARVTSLIQQDKYGKDSRLLLDKGVNIHDNLSYQKYFEQALNKLRVRENNSKRKKFSEAKQLKILNKIETILTGATNKAKFENNEQTPFAHTNQNRDFFGAARGFDNIPYAQSLFGVGLNTPGAREYLGDRIKDKIIYLLGGGDSAKDLIMSEDITPKQVVNLDPFIGAETISKVKNENYLSLPVLVQDTSAIEKETKQRNIGSADEMWASYSVPYYLATPEEIRGLFQTIKQFLAENGTARIAPISIQAGDAELYTKTKEEFIKQVKDLTASPEFNVYVTESTTGGTLFIERIPASNQESDQETFLANQQQVETNRAGKERDQKRIVEIRNELGI